MRCNFKKKKLTSGNKRNSYFSVSAKALCSKGHRRGAVAAASVYPRVQGNDRIHTFNPDSRGKRAGEDKSSMEGVFQFIFL